MDRAMVGPIVPAAVSIGTGERTFPGAPASMTPTSSRASASSVQPCDTLLYAPKRRSAHLGRLHQRPRARRRTPRPTSRPRPGLARTQLRRRNSTPSARTRPSPSPDPSSTTRIHFANASRPQDHDIIAAFGEHYAGLMDQVAQGAGRAVPARRGPRRACPRDRARRRHAERQAPSPAFTSIVPATMPRP